MNTQTDLNNLKEIYLISNTASYLYSGFSKDESLLDLKKDNSQEDLINEFIGITKKEIEKIDDLVFAYAIYIAIILFDNERTFEFLNSSGNINFEWFPELKNIYISRLKSFNFYNFEIKDFKTIHQKINSDSNEINNQKIEIA